ncbi:MAG: hypothetical protein AAGC70_02980 [Pseudomonadota bacterium]
MTFMGALGPIMGSIEIEPHKGTVFGIFGGVTSRIGFGGILGAGVLHGEAMYGVQAGPQGINIGVFVDGGALFALTGSGFAGQRNLKNSAPAISVTFNEPVGINDAEFGPNPFNNVETIDGISVPAPTNFAQQTADEFSGGDPNGELDGTPGDTGDAFGGNDGGSDPADQSGSAGSSGGGVFDANGDRFGEFRFWQDADGDAEVDVGELMTLADARSI